MYISHEQYKPTQYFSFKKLRGKGKKNQSLLERWISLDTETSHNHKEDKPDKVGWIYQWAFKFGDDVVYGRKPSELISTLNKIIEYYGLGEGKKLVIYVHNLSYDIQYLKDFLYREYGEYKILALKKRHFISYENDYFIFKCSYVLSNKSLDKWAKDLCCKNQKKIGLVDYEKIHYQSEELTQDDWVYMFGDVEVLDEAIEKQFALYGDDITTIPLTSTGYIRRDCRKAFQADKKEWKRFSATRLNKATYTLCRKEFSGGYTHGDRFRSGETIHPKKGETIRHRDFRSHYPSQQRTRYFPMGKFNLYKENASIDDIRTLTKDYCLLIDCVFTNIEIKDATITFPVIQTSKCIEGRIGTIKHVSDNGRILQLKGTVNLVCTELDLKWILRQYNIQYIKYTQVYTSVKGFLPEFMIETIDKYFHGKTMYKVLEEKEEDALKKLDYKKSLMKSKNGLNGIYGCTAQDPIRETILLDPEGEEPWRVEQIEDVQEALDKFYGNRNSFMRYQWGCWCTSHARDELFTFIYDIIGVERCLYGDTDSIFYLSNDDVEKRIAEYNERLLVRSERIGAFIEYEGEKVHYNQFCDEKENIIAFRFLHAKCYAYIDKDNGLHCTIAGVSARILDHIDKEGKPHYYTREEELGTIDNLKAGKVFNRCGGTSVTYTESQPFLYDNGIEMTECASSAIITKTTKTLSNEIECHLDVMFPMMGE